MQLVVDRLATLKAVQNKQTDEQEFASLINEAEAILADPDSVLAQYAPEMALA